MPVETTAPVSIAEDVRLAAATLNHFYQSLPNILYHLALSGVIIVLGLLLLKLIRRLINKSYRRKVQERNSREAETFRSLISSVVSYLSYFLIALTVLHIMGVDVSSILAVAGIGTVAIGFGAQALVKDIISGMFLWLEGNVAVGDVITAAGCSGVVVKVSLRTTTIRSTDGCCCVVPNGDIRTVICRSRDLVKSQVNVTLAHGQDMEKALEILKEECALLAEKVPSESAPTVVGCVANDARCVTIRCECSSRPEQDWEVERQMREALFARLYREGFKT